MIRMQAIDLSGLCNMAIIIEAGSGAYMDVFTAT